MLPAAHVVRAPRHRRGWTDEHRRTAMVTALVAAPGRRLRGGRRCRSSVPQRRAAPGAAPGAGRPARRLRAAAAAPDRRARCSPWSADRPAPASRRWSTPSSAPGSPSPACCGRPPARRCWCTTRPTPTWFDGRPDPAATSRARRARRTDTGALQLVRGRRRPGRAGDPRRPRHRLGRGAQPHAGRPAARRRRPVAVRHLRRALRRPGAVGLPQGRRRAQHRGRHRARPHRSRGASTRSPATWRAMLTARGLRDSPLFTVTEGTVDEQGLLPAESVAARSATGSTRSPPTPTRGPRWSSRRSTVRCATSPAAATTSPTRAPRRPRWSTRLRKDGRPGVRRGASSAVDEASRRRHACCAARCWPAGRSSSAPVSCSARWRRGSAGCATGSSAGCAASRSRSSGSPWRWSPGWSR